MEVILLEKIAKLGNLGDKVKVRPGFGRNYLIPQRKAVAATVENLKKFEEARAEYERNHAQALSTAQQRAEALAKVSVRMAVKVGSENKLYGSVGTADIAAAVTEAGVALAKREVHLPNGPIRELGEYDVQVSLHADLETTVHVSVVPEAVAA
jgi:large subunit ribosomal protein L9